MQNVKLPFVTITEIMLWGRGGGSFLQKQFLKKLIAGRYDGKKGYTSIQCALGPLSEHLEFQSTTAARDN